MYLRAFSCPMCKKCDLLDMTTAMLAVGKAEAAKQRLLNMDFVQGDAEKLSFSDNSFDIVISRLAFHHFPNPKRCFSEMVRVLKTGGKLVVMDMEAAEETLRNTEDEIETLRDPSHMRNLSRKNLQKCSKIVACLLQRWIERNFLFHYLLGSLLLIHLPK